MNNGASNYPGQGYATLAANSLWQYTIQPLTVSWEYQVLPRTDALGVSPLDLEGLNEAGAAGWEVCLVARDQYLMKRIGYRQATGPTP